MKIGCFQWPFSHNLALWQEHIFKFSQRTINKFLIWVILGPISIKNEWVIVTAQLQLQFNLSWCDLNLTLPNNFTPAQPPFTTQTLDICDIGWSKVIKSSRLFFWFQSTFFPGTHPSSSSYHLMELRVGTHILLLTICIFRREPHILAPYSHFR